MIIHCTSGAYLRGLLAYLHVAADGGNRVSSWSGSAPVASWAATVDVWEWSQALHERGDLEAWHYSINPIPTEAGEGRMTDDVFMRMGEVFANKVAPGHDWHAVVHRQEGRPHVHVALNPVSRDGKHRHRPWMQPGVKDLDSVRHQLGQEFSLSCVEGAGERKVGRKRYPKAQARLGGTGRAALDRVAALVEHAAGSSRQVEELYSLLVPEGISVGFSKTGGVVFGFMDDSGASWRVSPSVLGPGPGWWSGLCDQMSLK